MMPPTFLRPDWSFLDWSPFIPFAGSRNEIRAVPAGPGLYRIRVAGQDQLAYVGQTGRNLRERLGDLMRHTLAEEMPFNDPHTAAPKLWSYHHAALMNFEASAAVVEVTRKERLGMECLLLWQYRTEHGRSTLCNFGRLHLGYRTSRNRKTGIRGGFLNQGTLPEPEMSLSPLPLHSDPGSPDWMRLDWSERRPLRRREIDGSLGIPGLYLLVEAAGTIVYIGQSNRLAARLRSHCHPQTYGMDLDYSYARVPTATTTAQLLELGGE